MNDIFTAFGCHAKSFNSSVSSLLCFCPPTSKPPITGAISGRRCKARRRATCSGDGGALRVDWSRALACKRSRSADVLVPADFGLEGSDSLGLGARNEPLADVGVKARSWALIAPAFKSSSLRWPFAKMFNVDGVHFLIGRSGN